MKQPPTQHKKLSRGRPIIRQIQLNATPEEVAQAIFKTAQKPQKRET